MRTPNTFSYIICIKRKHADKEDPEETRDKEISGEPAASSLTENEFGFTFGHAISRASFFTLPPSLRRTTVLLRTCTRIDSRRVHSVGPRVLRPSSCIHAFYDRSAAALGVLCICTVLSVYTQGAGMYS